MYALPLSQDSKPVKAAIGAFGGAHKAFKLQTQTDTLTQSLAQSYETASIRQYNNAIRVLQEYMNSPGTNFQVVLTCCLIFICTECLYGRHDNVARHLEAAFSLLNAHHISNRGSEIPPRNKQNDLDKFMESIGPSLCCLASDLFFYMGGSHSSKLVTELQSWLHRQEPVYLQEPGAPFFSAQAAASSLTRMETMYGIIGMDMYDGCPMCLTMGHPCGMEGSTCQRYERGLDPESFFRYWSARYKFKLNFDHLTASEADIYRFKVLELEEIIWRATFKLKSMDDDLETSDCIQILEKIESIIKFSKIETGHIFTFQASLIPPIAYVIISCQDETIQWEGVRLLRSLDRREGVWDSQKVADVYANMITAKANRLLSWDDVPDDVPRLTELLRSVTLRTLPEAI
ncbi:transcription factor fss1 [Fusarium longipes]|uniref:Transcription factor fss1 n=1 Tax=Fusarium longipes TaxID=694270 RepID=A0A395T8E9_9HYPO|nr:transcription factor fss1 [Fusarium longipes]